LASKDKSIDYFSCLCGIFHRFFIEWGIYHTEFEDGTVYSCLEPLIDLAYNIHQLYYYGDSA
jgi:hypothetical protein